VREPRVGLVIGQLHRGGAEKQLTALAVGLQRSRAARPVVFCLSRVLEPYGGVLRDAGVALHSFSQRGVDKVGRVPALARRFSAEGIELIQAFLMGPTVLCALANLRRRRPFVASYRNSEQFRPPFRRRLESWALGRCDAVTTNARTALGFVQRYYGVPGERLRYIPNGVDTDAQLPPRDDARRCLDIPLEAQVILGLNRLAPQKNLELFCDTAEQVLAGHAAGLCVIAGDGPRRDWLRRRVARSSRPQQFRLLGATDAVGPLLAAADLLLLTSSFEGSPNAVLEALAAGLPVVATAAGDVPELVQDGQSGFVRAIDDGQGLVESCRFLLAHRDAASAFGRRGRQRVVAEFSMERMVERHAELYRSLLGGLAPS